jgi:hypothetical protein
MPWTLVVGGRAPVSFQTGFTNITVGNPQDTPLLVNLTLPDPQGGAPYTLMVRYTM